MKRPVRIRLLDILGAIEEAEEILDGKDLAAYKQSRITRRGVERCLEIISEASRFVPSELKDEHPDIPWLAVADMGNLLRHSYQRVDDEVVWRTAARSLQTLRVAVQAMLAEEESSTHGKE